MSDLNLCYGCMEPLGSDSVCAHCGYDQNTTSLANYLKPGTMLHERFYVGRMLEANGEGVTYTGASRIDVNLSGDVDVADAQCILNYYVKAMTGKPVTWAEITGNPNAPAE